MGRPHRPPSSTPTAGPPRLGRPDRPAGRAGLARLIAAGGVLRRTIVYPGPPSPTTRLLPAGGRRPATSVECGPPRCSGTNDKRVDHVRSHLLAAGHAGL